MSSNACVARAAIACFRAALPFLGVATAAAQFCNYGEPAGDDCSAPRLISGAEGQHVVLMDCVGAAGGGVIGDVIVGNLVCFDFVPTVSGPITISTCHPNTLYDTVVGLYRRNQLCEFEFLAYNDDAGAGACPEHCTGWGSELAWSVTAGVTYTIMVGSYNNNPLGCPLCLGLIVTIGEPCGEPPRNFICDAAQPLAGLPGTQVVTIDALDAIGSENWTCQGSVGHAVWFQVSPQHSGRLRVDSCMVGTNYDTVARILTMPTGCSGTMLAVACADDPGCGQHPYATWLEVPVTAAENYYVEIAGFAAQTGCLHVAFTLTATETGACCLEAGAVCDVTDRLTCEQRGGRYVETSSACTDGNGNGVADSCEWRRGDTDCNGRIDFFDIDPFLLALFEPAGYEARYPNCALQSADVSGDGHVDFFDIDPFLACLLGGPCP